MIQKYITSLIKCKHIKLPCDCIDNQPKSKFDDRIKIIDLECW